MMGDEKLKLLIGELKLCESDNQILDNLIDKLSDEEIKKVIEVNNNDLQAMVNEDPLNIESNEAIRKLFLLNVKLYQVSKKRDINAIGFSFMCALGTLLGYDTNIKTFEIIEQGQNNLTKTR